MLPNGEKSAGQIENSRVVCTEFLICVLTHKINSEMCSSAFSTYPTVPNVYLIR